MRKLKEFLKNQKILISLAIISLISSFLLSYTVYADDETVDTTVSVNNAAPTFLVSPVEEDSNSGTLPASAYSSSTYPTNESDTITFKATGDDNDGNNYYLAICKTNSVTPNNDAPPTCGGGSWCVSSSTTDEAEASCEHVAGSGTDATDEVNAWYAFVCDHNPGSQCSSASQGSGDSGSPFVVNHTPEFTNLTNNTETTPIDPGGTVTFTSTASDADTDGAADELYLLVCSTNSVNQATSYSQPTCGGTQIARTSTSSSSNPTASYATPSIYNDGVFSGYGFVYDEHYSTTAATPSQINSTWTVNNVAPTVAINQFDLDDGVNPIDENITTVTLTESSTIDLIGRVTVTDNNSCQDVTSGGSVVIDLFGNWTDGGWTGTHGECDCDDASCGGDETDYDRCYPKISCTANLSSCSGSGDDTVDYDCTIPMRYYAEGTGTGSEHTSGNWHSYVTVTDDDSATADNSVTNLSVNLLIAFSSETSIGYGSYDAGQISSIQTTLVTATGNTGIDTEVSGTDMTSGGDTIPVASQEYAGETFTHGSAPGVDLSTTANELELNVPKTNWTTSLQIGQSSIYWGLEIPSDTPSGTYTGSNTLTAIQAELTDW